MEENKKIKKEIGKNHFKKWLTIFLLFSFVFLIVFRAFFNNQVIPARDWNFWQIKKISNLVEKKNDNFSFAVFGDNKNSFSLFNQLIDKINGDKSLLFAVDNGDLVYRGGIKEFSLFLEQIKKMNMPVLTVAGNHDISGTSGMANYYRIFGRMYYSFPLKNAYFIILDDANERDMGKWQIEWLKKELKKADKYKYRFVFMHVPLYDPRKGPYQLLGHSLKDKNFARKLNNLFDKAKLTMLFTSHIHGFFSGYWQRTPYIITGGAGAELAGGNDPNHYFYHYIKVSVSNNGVHYKVIRLSKNYSFFVRLLYGAWVYFYIFLLANFLDIIIIIVIILIIFIAFPNHLGKIIKLLKAGNHYEDS